MIAIPVEPPITEYLHAKAARQGDTSERNL